MVPDAPTQARPAWDLAAVAALLWLAHGAELVYRGEGIDLCWICNLAGPLLAIGCALALPSLVAVPLLWLTFGTGFWVLDMLGGGDVLITSFGSHLGVLVVGALAVRRLGWPRGAWWRAVAAQLGVLLLSRIATPAERNINLAFGVWPGWEDLFPSYWVYFAIILLGSAVTYRVLELPFARLGRAREDGRPQCAT